MEARSRDWTDLQLSGATTSSPAGARAILLSHELAAGSTPVRGALHRKALGYGGEH